MTHFNIHRHTRREQIKNEWDETDLTIIEPPYTFHCATTNKHHGRQTCYFLYVNFTFNFSLRKANRIKKPWPLRLLRLPQSPRVLPSPRSVISILAWRISNTNVWSSPAAYARTRRRSVMSACFSQRPKTLLPTAYPSSINTRAACRASASASNFGGFSLV